MGNSIVPLDGAFAPEEARGWEGKIFRQVCEQGQREAMAYLDELEEALFEQRPAGWVVVGFRERSARDAHGRSAPSPSIVSR